jgi:hypothetical protein
MHESDRGTAGALRPDGHVVRKAPFSQGAFGLRVRNLAKDALNVVD